MIEGSLTSSIGADWPPVHGTNERIRGFYPEVVEYAHDATRFMEELEGLQCLTEIDERVDRLSVRVVASTAIIAMLHNEGVTIEGTLPVANKGRELFIAYTAWNADHRRMTDERLASHHAIFRDVMSRDRILDHPADTLRAKGFEPRVLDSSVSINERLAAAPKFFALYERFHYDEQSVKDILMDPTNRIAYVEDAEGHVASTVLAEQADVKVEGCGTIRLVELTEAVTRPELQGHDLYRAVSGLVTRQIVAANHENPKVPVDVLYGESNLSSPGVIYAAWKNGRNIGHYDGHRFGIDSDRFGILEQNFSVDDGNEDRPYNDFALTYMPLD